MLQQSLEGLLIEGLQTSNLDMVRHCLRTYATIDKTRDAEALVGQVLVKPYMDQVNIPHFFSYTVNCSYFLFWWLGLRKNILFFFICKVIIEEVVKSSQNGLQLMYTRLLEFVPHHCRLLREVTGGAVSRYWGYHIGNSVQGMRSARNYSLCFRFFTLDMQMVYFTLELLQNDLIKHIIKMHHIMVTTSSYYDICKIFMWKTVTFR